jgi:periplasmic protein TonB
MLRCSILSGRSTAWVTSIALHVAAVTAGGRAMSQAANGTVRDAVSIEVEVQRAQTPATLPASAALATLVASAEKPRSAPARGARRAGHRHDDPVSDDHDARPHDASEKHLAASAPRAPMDQRTPAPLEPATVVEASSASLPRFVLAPTDGIATRGSGARAPTSAGLGEHAAAASAGAGSRGRGPIWSDSDVDTPARLLSSVPVIYPEAARAAEIEADVPLELVVDDEGRVAVAKILGEHADGVGEAALRAVRAYRFSPARRAGYPVRVRMRWAVAFRLQ